MQLFSLQQLAGNTDIYLIDQILKGRYLQNDIVLDAGCGIGRNLHWFLLNQIDCFAIDKDAMAIDQLKSQYPHFPDDRFQVSAVEKIPFADCFFDHIISSAVLHFARNQQHFFAMIGEMERVLQPGGSLFIRMTTDKGIENLVELIEDGVYLIPDGSTRFLLTRPILARLLNTYPFTLMEEVKTVNVNDTRCMMTLMLQKNIGSQV
jgi:ubiquinone/menaquinone biosynthesis C-methylase UbiE